MSTLKSAFFVKNVPTWERAVRVASSAAALVLGWSLGSPYRELGAATAAMLLVTGIVGFCPMCALIGRKLPTSAARH